ncbi:MAG: NAD(P)H-hydrate dehydratase [Myxococcota bacterium]
MKPIYAAAAVRELDRRMIEDRGLPSLALMEAAVALLARELREARPDVLQASVCVACGPGNNGGDGYALARWLHGWGVDVRVWPVVPPATDDARAMAAIARDVGVPTCPGPDGDWIIDALFGTGLSRDLEGAVAAATASFADRKVVAIDLPSGLDADTGTWRGPTFEAALTLTLARLKPGLFAGAGPTVAGEVRLVDIGLDVVATDDDAHAWLLEAVDVAWPRRGRADHKGRSGHVLVVAGSVAMAGAAVLACEGALSAGAGLVTLAIPLEATPRLAVLPPEVMVVHDPLAQLSLARWDAVVVGPGLGGGRALSHKARAALTGWWASALVPLVYDADALDCTGAPGVPTARVLTPHPGEAGRLLGMSSAEVQADRFRAVARLRDRGIALLKGPHTLVADATRITVNPTGSPALATGGSGDVLAGVIGALLARGLDAGDAARTGAWVHGAAGDRLWTRRQTGWRATDIARAVADVAGDLLA